MKEVVYFSSLLPLKFCDAVPSVVVYFWKPLDTVSGFAAFFLFLHHASKSSYHAMLLNELSRLCHTFQVYVLKFCK